VVGEGWGWVARRVLKAVAARLSQREDWSWCVWMEGRTLKKEAVRREVRKATVGVSLVDVFWKEAEVGRAPARSPKAWVVLEREWVVVEREREMEPEGVVEGCDRMEAEEGVVT